jgi:hypothetical protein
MTTSRLPTGNRIIKRPDDEPRTGLLWSGAVGERFRYRGCRFCSRLYLGFDIHRSLLGLIAAGLVAA